MLVLLFQTDSLPFGGAEPLKRLSDSAMPFIKIEIAFQLISRMMGKEVADAKGSSQRKFFIGVMVRYSSESYEMVS